MRSLQPCCRWAAPLLKERMLHEQAQVASLHTAQRCMTQATWADL